MRYSIDNMFFVFNTFFFGKKILLRNFFLIFHNINWLKASLIMRVMGLNNFFFIINLKESYLLRNAFFIVKEKFYFDYMSQKRNNVNKLKKKWLFIGIRHSRNLPVRGQRTHTNAKTRKKFNIY